MEKSYFARISNMIDDGRIGDVEPSDLSDYISHLRQVARQGGNIQLSKGQMAIAVSNHIANVEGIGKDDLWEIISEEIGTRLDKFLSGRKFENIIERSAMEKIDGLRASRVESLYITALKDAFGESFEFTAKPKGDGGSDEPSLLSE